VPNGIDKSKYLAARERQKHDTNYELVRNLDLEQSDLHDHILRAMTPNPGLDKFRLREIEHQLAGEVNAARERARLASTEGNEHNALAAYLLALGRFTEFTTKGLVPEEFLQSPGGSDRKNG